MLVIPKTRLPVLVACAIVFKKKIYLLLVDLFRPFAFVEGV